MAVGHRLARSWICASQSCGRLRGTYGGYPSAPRRNGPTYSPRSAPGYGGPGYNTHAAVRAIVRRGSPELWRLRMERRAMAAEVVM